MVRSFASEPERQLQQYRMATGWGHIRPNSVLVAVIGNHYAPTCWQHIADMIQHTNAQGVCCGFQEMQDRCFDPYDALGTMRNEAIMTAMGEGYEFLCYLDADVQPEKDTLLKLLAWQMSNVPPAIVAPYVVEPGTGKKLHGPHREPYTGLQVVKWAVLSMLLFNTKVFDCFQDPASFWADAVGADEGFHFQKLAMKGHRPYIDTNVPLVVAGKPHYPLATNRFTSAQRAEHWDTINQERMKPPDRRPIDPKSTQVDQIGDYMPFAPPPAEQQTSATAQTSTTGTVLPPASIEVREPVGAGVITIGNAP